MTLYTDSKSFLTDKTKAVKLKIVTLCIENSVSKIWMFRK